MFELNVLKRDVHLVEGSEVDINESLSIKIN